MHATYPIITGGKKLSALFIPKFLTLPRKVIKLRYCWIRCLYRVFHLDSTPFILQVEQHKLYSCSIYYLSEKLQGLWYRHLDFLFSKYSNSRTKNGRNVYFSSKWEKLMVAFLVKKFETWVVWFVKYEKFNTKKWLKNFLIF